MTKRIYPTKVASQKRWYKSKLIECDCGFGHTFLKIDYESFDGKEILTDDEQPTWYVRICFDAFGLKDRIKRAWDVLRGRKSYLYCISIDAQDIKELRDTADHWLNNLEPELREELTDEINSCVT